MKFSPVLVSVIAASIFEPAFAYPGMAAKFRDIGKRISKRDNPVGVNIPLGDLAGSIKTTVGKTISQCLDNTIDCYTTDPKTYVAPAMLSLQCVLDTCCVWDYVQKDLVAQFLNSDGTCNQLARAAIRLGFHDAGPWYVGAPYGGADGSIVLNGAEMTRSENNGLQNIVAFAKTIHAKYPLLGMADLIQFMATIATVTCPLGPRMMFFTGRPDNYLFPNLPNLMPSINSDADTLINLFMAKTINPSNLVALIGAHTTANQFFAFPGQSGSSLDPSPGVWDDTFYNFTSNANATAQGVTKFPSDVKLAVAPQTASTWNSFTDSHLGRDTWDNTFSRAYIRLSLLGVQKIQEMTDCSKVIPSQVMVFNNDLGLDNNAGPQPA